MPARCGSGRGQPATTARCSPCAERARLEQVQGSAGMRSPRPPLIHSGCRELLGAARSRGGYGAVRRSGRDASRRLGSGHRALEPVQPFVQCPQRTGQAGQPRSLCFRFLIFSNPGQLADLQHVAEGEGAPELGAAGGISPGRREDPDHPQDAAGNCPSRPRPGNCRTIRPTSRSRWCSPRLTPCCGPLAHLRQQHPPEAQEARRARVLAEIEQGLLIQPRPQAARGRRDLPTHTGRSSELNIRSHTAL